MAYDETLADRVRDVLAGRPGVREQKMFGGLAFMLDGNMACGILRGELIVRVGKENLDDALAHPDARIFDMTGRPMRSFVYVAAEGWPPTKDWSTGPAEALPTPPLCRQNRIVGWVLLTPAPP